MWAEACEILDQADRLHRHFFKPAITNTQRTTWEPPIDIYESSDEVKIVIALPGVITENLKVLLEGQSLIIEGRRYLPVKTEYYIRRIEIPYGHFERHIELQNGDYELGTRELINGCLSISLRKL
jgi:HSP20 family molecular chaperone IbpA